MKKICLSLLILIVLLGITSYLITASQHRLNLNQLTLQRLTTKAIPVTTFKHLTLQLRTAKVIVKPGTKTAITCQNVTENELKLSQVAGHVTLKQATATKHQLEIGHTPVITMTIAHPQTLTAISGELLNGTLVLNHLTLQQLQFKHVNGTTQLQAVKLTHGGTLQKQNGATILQALQTAGLAIQLKNGQVSVNGVKKGPAYHQNGADPLIIRNRNGQVKLTTN